MRIATYNLHKGGSPRVHLLKMIREESVDLLCVQESCALHDHLPPLLYPGLQEYSAWSAVTGNGWGSGIIFPKGKVTAVPFSKFAGWVTCAEIIGGNLACDAAAPMLVFSVHAPTGRGTYTKVVNQILDEIRLVASGREIILGGDFNLTISKGAGSSRIPTDNELEIQERLGEEFGLMNCWLAANPNQPLPQTLRWRNNPSTVYHCDGLFAPKSWANLLVTCNVLTGGDWNSLSDHNPVVAEFLPVPHADDARSARICFVALMLCTIPVEHLWGFQHHLITRR